MCPNNLHRHDVEIYETIEIYIKLLLLKRTLIQKGTKSLITIVQTHTQIPL